MVSGPPIHHLRRNCAGLCLRGAYPEFDVSIAGGATLQRKSILDEIGLPAIDAQYGQ